MACVQARPLWKVAEIAGNRKIRLGIRKRMENAPTPLLLIVISAIFITASQQTFFQLLRGYELPFLELISMARRIRLRCFKSKVMSNNWWERKIYTYIFELSVGMRLWIPFTFALVYVVPDNRRTSLNKRMFSYICISYIHIYIYI